MHNHNSCCVCCIVGLVGGILVDPVLKKKFFSAAQKKSKLWINDIHLYLRHLVQYGAKRSSQTKVIRVQSLVSVFFAGELGLRCLCRRKNP